MAGVLVVGDDSGFGRALVRYLIMAGFHPLLASSATEALVLASRATPDSFLIDWCLGRRSSVNGVALTRRLRSMEKSMDRPIVVMSGIMESVQDEVIALKAGADFFWVKDFTRREPLFRHISALQSPGYPLGKHLPQAAGACP